eukprot:3539178-Prymnesium_polylepis.1
MRRRRLARRVVLELAEVDALARVVDPVADGVVAAAEHLRDVRLVRHVCEAAGGGRLPRAPHARADRRPIGARRQSGGAHEVPRAPRAARARTRAR